MNRVVGDRLAFAVVVRRPIWPDENDLTKAEVM
jgi:hypothetical protein